LGTSYPPQQPQQPQQMPPQQPIGYSPQQPPAFPQTPQSADNVGQRYLSWLKRRPVLGGCVSLIAACVILSVCGVALQAIGGGGKSSTDTGTQQTSQRHATNTSRPPTVTPKPVGPIFQQSGSGSTKTKNFDASGDWTVAWTCNPASSFGGQYNLIVSVNNSDGSLADPAGINVICKTGTTSGSTVEHNLSGTFYLDIISEGDWTFTVTPA